MKIVIDRYKRMYETPLQDVNVYCEKCKLLKATYEKMIEDKITKEDLGDLRKKCTKCKTSKDGIYKADAILGAYNPKKNKLPVGKGKSSLITKKNKEAILEQIKQGISYREISRRTGYSIATISRIKNENEKEKEKKKRC